MSGMFSLLSLQVLEKLDLEVLDFGIFQNWLFWTGINLVYQTCKNFCICVVLLECLSYLLHSCLTLHMFTQMYAFSLIMCCTHQWVITVTQIPDIVSF